MDNVLQGTEHLTEDDFHDFAAAVGEGVDGSDDDTRSDDFLSWLLVHADTIDPIINSDVLDDRIEAAQPDTSSAPSAVEQEAAGGVRGSAASSTLALASERTNPAGLKFDPQVGFSVPPHPFGANLPATAENPALAPLTTATAAVLPGVTPVAGSEKGDERGSRGHDATGRGLAATRDLHGEIAAAGGIPSDPFLAMQMGARMALAGKLNLIPLGTLTGGGDGGGGGDGSSTAPLAEVPQPAPEDGTPVLSSPATPSVTVDEALPLAKAPELPTWTELPPPPPAPTTPKSETLVSPEAFQAHAPSAGTASSASMDGQFLSTSEGDRGSDSARSAVLESDTPSFVGLKRARTASGSPPEARVGQESFKDGRRRKRMSIGELEERVKLVSADNARLKLHLADVNDKVKLMARRKQAMEVEIAAKLGSHRAEPSEANKERLAEALSRFKDLYADYGAHRRQEVQFHLKQLERQIVPTDTTKMSLWTLEQDESFYKDRKRGSLSLILRKELGVSEEQIGRIQERRTRIKSLLAELGESLRLVRDLQKSSEAKNAKFEEVMARLQSSFSPQQIASLLLWVSTNRAHISKLPLLPKHILQQRAHIE